MCQNVLYYQAGVLTIAITCNGIRLTEGCCDSQTHIREMELIKATVAILNLVFNTNGFICLDFNDLSGCLKESKEFAIAKLHGVGESRVDDALSHIKDKLPDVDFKKIDKLIIAVYFNRDSKRPLVMAEAQGITTFIASLPETVDAIYGKSHDESLVGDSVRVELIMSGKDLVI